MIYPVGRMVTVVIPTIQVRREMLDRAVRSAWRQLLEPTALAISVDVERMGAGPTRNRGMTMVQTEWTAFLDDDDELMPHHLQTLIRAAEETGADVLWPWFEVVGGADPFPMHFGRQFDINEPHIFPITALVRTEAIRDSKALFPAPNPMFADWAGDDFPFWLQLAQSGATFHHVAERTWRWHHHSGNTSGLPSRW